MKPTQEQRIAAGVKEMRNIFFWRHFKTVGERQEVYIKVLKFYSGQSGGND